MSAMAPLIPVFRLFAESFVQAQIKEKRDRWIPRTKAK